MTLLVDVTLPGQPVSKGRPRLGRGGTYTPERTRQAEREWRFQVLAEKGVYGLPIPAAGPVSVSLWFYCATRRRRDLDNMVKLVLDSLNGVVWLDDSQVVQLDARMELGAAEPRTVLRVWALDEQQEAA